MFPDADVTAIKIEFFEIPPIRCAQPIIWMRAALRPSHFGSACSSRSVPFTARSLRHFHASERRSAVEFPYAWREFDEIHFQLPAHWALDNADSPGRMDLGSPVIRKMCSALTSRNELISKRELVFGRGGALYYEPKITRKLKNAFDLIQLRDQHSISLKEAN